MKSNLNENFIYKGKSKIKMREIAKKLYEENPSINDEIPVANSKILY